VPLRIAILGTRGIPANYGGFETFAEELSKRLVLRGHRVIVYCRERHSSQSYLGVELRHLPTIRHKYFDTLAHTGLSTLHLLFHRSDVALYCNAANAIFTWMPRALGIPVALNVDGLERKRKKWNRLARAWYVLSERLATWFPNRAVSDARQIADYYLQTYGAETTFISYGAPVGKVSSTITVERLGLTPGGYFLYVTRFEPENNPLLVRESIGYERQTGPDRRRSLRTRLHSERACHDESQSDPTRVHLRRWLPRTTVALPGIRACHRGGRHSSSVDRGYGARLPGALFKHSRKR
jgi:glycosyltransferase involved in cell wall biosynthesis